MVNIFRTSIARNIHTYTTRTTNFVCLTKPSPLKLPEKSAGRVHFQDRMTGKDIQTAQSYHDSLNVSKLPSQLSELYGLTSYLIPVSRY